MRRRGGVAAGLCSCLLLFAPSAEAAFEGVGTFAEDPQVGYLRTETLASMAVNASGAGGVPAGTLYAVNQRHGAVFRYSPQGEFREGWGWGVSEPRLSPSQFERCGPDGEPAHPLCHSPENNGHVGEGGEGLAQLFNPIGVAVDQSTGYVYVLNERRQHGVVEVFSADGSQLISSFGERPECPPFYGCETVEENPEKVHETVFSAAIAVDDSGSVYLADSSAGPSRVMVFKPQSPGDYEHYAYTGQANDIATSGHLGLDDAGNLYSAVGEGIRQFAPGEPDLPVCEYDTADADFFVAGGGLLAISVDPKRGEVFYWDYSSPKFIHHLKACNGQGEFKEKTPIPMAPKPEGDIWALAFNPALAWEPFRPKGILYAADSYNSRGYLFAPAEVHLPLVESHSVSSLTSTRALLRAQVNPGGSITRYAFQYLTEDAWEANEPTERFAGATEAPPGGAPLPALEEGLNVSTSPNGLSPDTAYRFRVIATSHCDPEHEAELCEDAAEGEAFRTLPPPPEEEGSSSPTAPPLFEAPLATPSERRVQRRCKRGLVRRQGKCVRRHRRHHRHRAG